MSKKMKKCIIFILAVCSIFTIVLNKTKIVGNVIMPAKCVELVKAKLNLCKYELYHLYDSYLKERYLLVQGEKSYLIYDLKIDDYAEYSLESKYSLYIPDKECKNIYIAPSLSYYYLGGNYYETYVGNKLDTNHLKNIKDFDDEKYRSLVERQETNLPKSEASDHYISNAVYFLNLTTNYGDNASLYPYSCSYVALEMLLAYYDTYYNDSIIIENFDINSYEEFSSFSGISINDYASSPGTGSFFHTYMIGLGRNLGYTEYGSNIINYYDIEDFLGDYASIYSLSISVYLNDSDNLTDLFNFCKSAINNNNPLMMSISKNYYDEDMNHSFVAYGYSSDGVYAHNGRKGSLYENNICINKNYFLIGLYISFSGMNHSHSNNYGWEIDDCSGYICPYDDYIYASHYNWVYNNNYGVASHQMHCECCGCSKYEPHDFLPFGLGYKCSVCGYFTRNPIIVNGAIEDDE